MFEARKARNNYDNCPNRSVDSSAYKQKLTCPKYPTGVDTSTNYEMSTLHGRGEVTTRLGCLGCQYADVQVESKVVVTMAPDGAVVQYTEFTFPEAEPTE